MSVPTIPSEQRLLRVSEVAEMLGVSRSSVYELIGRRRLQGVRIGRSVRVPADAFERFIRALEEEATTGAH